MLKLRKKLAAAGIAAILLFAAGPVGANSPAPPPPETWAFSAAVYFINNSDCDLYVEVDEAEENMAAVGGSFYDTFFCAEAGDALLTTLWITGEQNQASCDPNGLLAAIRLYDLADGSLLRTLTVAPDTFSIATEYPAGSHIRVYQFTVTNALLQGGPDEH